MEQLFGNFFSQMSYPLNPAAGLALALISVWSLFWKGLALWKAAHDKHKVWFVAILILNTAGILEIIYLFVASKSKITPSKFINYLKG